MWSSQVVLSLVRTAFGVRPVIGQRGFGFERETDGKPVSFPHFGSVVIGDYVEIEPQYGGRWRAKRHYTGDFVKTDDHVHIAHNVFIGDKKTFITACSEISGSVSIGQQVCQGPIVQLSMAYKFMR